MKLDLHGSTLAFLVVCAAPMLGACGGSERATGPSGTPDAGVEAGSGDGSSAGNETGSGVDASGRTDAGRVPLNHRPSDAQCSAPAAAGDCASPGPPPGGCTSDAVCTAGINGRCINQGGGPAADCFCTYDACVHDGDCPTGQTCACHGAPYTDGRDNTCITGNCRVDADCGPAGYCSPSSRLAFCGDSLAGYYCHTPQDQCLDDTDCVASGPSAPVCAYSTKDGRWECGQAPICL